MTTGKNAADICRERGWGPGTVLIWPDWFKDRGVYRAVITRLEPRYVCVLEDDRGRLETVLHAVTAESARKLGTVQKTGLAWPAPTTWPEATTHKLKCWPAMFQAVKTGAKTCEIRKDDRGFKVFDRLHLCEFDPDTQVYTGGELTALVTHIVRGPDWGLSEGLVVMSIRVIQEGDQ